jgi:hypothetical protein
MLELGSGFISFVSGKHYKSQMLDWVMRRVFEVSQAQTNDFVVGWSSEVT